MVTYRHNRIIWENLWRENSKWTTMLELVNFVGKYCYFIRVISGCDSPLIALNGKIASQRKIEKEFPSVYVHVCLHYVFNDNVPLL